MTRIRGPPNPITTRAVNPFEYYSNVNSRNRSLAAGKLEKYTHATFVQINYNGCFSHDADPRRAFLHMLSFSFSACICELV